MSFGMLLNAWKYIQIGYSVYTTLKKAGVDVRKPVKEIQEAVAVSMTTARAVKDIVGEKSET